MLRCASEFSGTPPSLWKNSIRYSSAILTFSFSVRVAAFGLNRAHFLFIAQALLKFFRPLPGGVKNCEDSHLVLFYPVRDDERRA
jgi:hypothetical protein